MASPSARRQARAQLSALTVSASDVQQAGVGADRRRPAQPGGCAGPAVSGPAVSGPAVSARPFLRPWQVANTFFNLHVLGLLPAFMRSQSAVSAILGQWLPELGRPEVAAAAICTEIHPWVDAASCFPQTVLLTKLPSMTVTLFVLSKVAHGFAEVVEGALQYWSLCSRHGCRVVQSPACQHRGGEQFKCIKHFYLNSSQPQRWQPAYV